MVLIAHRMGLGVRRPSLESAGGLTLSAKNLMNE